MRWSFTDNVSTFVHKRRAASAQSAEDVFAKLTEWTRGFETLREPAAAGNQDEVLTTFEWNMVCLRFVVEPHVHECSFADEADHWIRNPH